MTDTRRMEDIVRPHATVADRIRALNAAGVPRAEIARFLGKRYQHVRNVLEGDAQSGGGGYTLGRADLSGVRESPAPFEPDGDDPTLVQARRHGIYRLVVRPDGSIMLPKAVAEAFETDKTHVVMGELDGDEFTLVSVRTSVDRVRAWVKTLNIPPGVSLADELIADRKAEAERDD